MDTGPILGACLPNTLKKVAIMEQVEITDPTKKRTEMKWLQGNDTLGTLGPGQSSIPASGACPDPKTLLSRARMRSRGKAMPSCLCVFQQKY